MKTNRLVMAVLGLSTLAAVSATAGVGVQINIPAPVVQVPAPVIGLPAPVVTVGVPDSYVWDGTEYVGVVGSQYFYLGPNNVWLTMDGPRLAHFHDYERAHADWRVHAIRNERFRNDAHGHNVPLRDDRNVRAHDIRDSHDAHDIDRAHDGHDHDHH
jgi:hypothetical protein